MAGAAVTTSAQIAFADAVHEIRHLWPTVRFDHRPYLEGTESHADYASHSTEDFRIRYAAFKFAVASILIPDSIVEIGVRGGISAMAFLAARPNALFTGYDNNRDSREYGIDFSSIAKRNFMSVDARAAVIEEDSQMKPGFSSCDLCHIDGNHTFAAVRHDVRAAWRGGARWILCDDTNDAATAAGIFTALSVDLNRGSVQWASFPDAWTGNILIRTDNEGSS